MKENPHHTEEMVQDFRRGLSAVVSQAEYREGELARWTRPSELCETVRDPVGVRPRDPGSLGCGHLRLPTQVGEGGPGSGTEAGRLRWSPWPLHPQLSGEGSELTCEAFDIVPNRPAKFTHTFLCVFSGSVTKFH